MESIKKSAKLTRSESASANVLSQIFNQDYTSARTKKLDSYLENKYVSIRNSSTQDLLKYNFERSSSLTPTPQVNTAGIKERISDARLSSK